MKLIKRLAQMAKPVVPGLESHGKTIYVYSEVRTGRVIYSLTRVMDNKKALDQLTFVGKKSVPAALRKDMWKPMAILSFGTNEIGLDAYRELREWRKMHEFCWDPKDRQGINKKAFTRKLMDQRLNSIADMAATVTRSFRRQRAEQSEEWLGEFKKRMKVQRKALAKDEPKKVAADEIKPENQELRESRVNTETAEQVKADAAANPDIKIDEAIVAPATGLASPSPAVLELLSAQMVVRIAWSNVLDAEYARSWPPTVVHYALPSSRHVSPSPGEYLSDQDKEQSRAAWEAPQTPSGFTSPTPS